MKNSQKGFIVPLLIIIVLLVIGGGVYVYESRKVGTPAIVNSNQAKQTNTQTTPTSPQNPTPSVSGNSNTTQASIVVTSAKFGAANSIYSQIIFVGYTTKNIQTANLTAYLYSVTTGGNAAQFPLSNLGGEYWGTGSGEISLSLDDLKSKGVIIPSGQYKVFLCDNDINDSSSLEKLLCGTSQIISITSSQQSANPAATNVPSLSVYDDDTASGNNFGFSFSYPNAWTLTKKNNVITLGNTNQYGDNITITEVAGNSVTSSSGKFGSVTYTYQNGQLMTTGIPDERTGIGTAGVATPLFTVGNGWPVVQGLTSWKTYIVYIYGKGFLTIDSGASGSTSDLDSFVKGIKSTSNTSNPNM